MSTEFLQLYKVTTVALTYRIKTVMCHKHEVSRNHTLLVHRINLHTSEAKARNIHIPVPQDVS